MSKTITYASLYVGIKEESISFYSKYLGFTVYKKVQLGDEEHWLILRKEEQDKTGLILIRAEEEKPNCSTLILTSNDCIMEYCKLKDSGLNNLSTPLYSTLGLSFFCYDPSGNKIVILEERKYDDTII